MDEIINYILTNKEWIFSGVGLLIFSSIACIVKFFYSKKKKTKNSMYQINDNHSSGNQIGTQNNYYGKENNNDRSSH